jgi:hypothetical protein
MNEVRNVLEMREDGEPPSSSLRTSPIRHDLCKAYFKTYEPRITLQSKPHVKTARTETEAFQLIKAGFEYVWEIGDAKLFRKRH